MIVKNEAEQLPRCLASAEAHIDDLVVVDTGSTDDTVAIAQKFGGRVFSFAWRDDFGAARNYALEQVKSDWVLVLDADEELVVHDGHFRHTLAQARPQVLTMVRQEVGVRSALTGFTVQRLFPPHLRYRGRFHEQLEVTNLAVAHFPALSIRHYGYQPDRLPSKLRRNIPILESIRQGGEMDLGLLYALADMYEGVSNPRAAADCYQELLDRLLPAVLDNSPPTLGALPLIMQRLGEQCLKANDLDTAKILCQRGISWFPTYPPLLYLSGEFLCRLDLPLAATAYYQECLDLGSQQAYYQGVPFNHHYMTVDAAYRLGCAFQAAHDIPAAQQAFTLALSFDPNHGPSQVALAQMQTPN